MNTVETEHGKIENNGQMFPLPHFQLKSVNICTSLTSKLKTYMETCFLVFTAGKRSCGKVMFLHLSVSHSVHMGSGGGLCMMSFRNSCLAAWFHVPLGVCLVPCFFWRGLCPGGRVFPGQRNLPCMVKSRRYASYWNVFLFGFFTN